jgi:hypothetical protein
VVLLDESLALPELPAPVNAIDCRSLPLAAFLERDFTRTVYLYACTADDVGAPFVEAIIARGGVFVPVHEAVPSSYAHTNQLARRVLECEYEDQKRTGFAKWDFGPHDFVNLLQAIDITRHLPGAFVEIGCYRGSSGCVALRYLREIALARQCYFFDVFEGFTYTEAKNSADAWWAGTHVTEGLAQVEARLRRYEAPGCGPTVFVSKRNIIREELPSDIDQICVANIDVDLYEAVGAALRKVAPRIVRGGILIVEDPGHTPLLIGARVALNQFLRSELAAPFMPIYMQSGQTFLVRME